MHSPLLGSGAGAGGPGANTTLLAMSLAGNAPTSMSPLTNLSSLLSAGGSDMVVDQGTADININDVLDLLPVSTDWSGGSSNNNTTVPSTFNNISSSGNGTITSPQTPVTTQVSWSNMVNMQPTAASTIRSSSTSSQRPLKSPISPAAGAPYSTARSPGYAGPPVAGGNQRSPASASGYGPTPSPGSMVMNQRSPMQQQQQTGGPGTGGYSRSHTPGSTIMSPPPIRKYMHVYLP